MPSMTVRVLYFAIVRERIGLAQETLGVRAGASAADVLEEVFRLHPGVAAYRGKLRLAVNEELVPLDSPVRDGDEVALIPPVAGGAGPLVRLADRPLSVDEVVAAVTHPGAGGICVFLGIVRADNAGRPVTSLDYEAFGSMAVREMTKIAEEIEAEVAGARIAAVHRVGHLDVGEPAVAIAASAPHRAEAFSACRTMIDRIKDRVPIWKREHGPEGDSWVGI